MAREKRRAFGWIVTGILCIALGIYMVVRPDSFKQILLIALGAGALASSIVSFTRIKRYQNSRLTFSTTIFKGITGIVVGLLAVILPIVASQEIWNVLMYILGAQFALGAITLFIDASSLKNTEFFSKPLIIEGFVSLILALFLFIFPREVASLLITLLAIIIMVVGLTFILIGYFSSKKKRDIESTFEVLKEE